MRVTALADQHGTLPEVLPCDLLLIAGDVCPIEEHDIDYQLHWLDHEFRDWLEAIPAKQIVGIAGNHDFCFEEAPDRLPTLPWTYLLDTGTEVNDLKIWGSPWVPNLPKWAFYADDPTRRDKWELIPEDTDILMTHGPPAGILDKTGPKYGNIEVGCPILHVRVKLHVEPKLHVFGHIHEAWGQQKFWDTTFANVSVLDENYRRVHYPTEFAL